MIFIFLRENTFFRARGVPRRNAKKEPFPWVDLYTHVGRMARPSRCIEYPTISSTSQESDTLFPLGHAQEVMRLGSLLFCQRIHGLLRPVSYSLWNSLPASRQLPSLELPASVNGYSAINCHYGTPCQPQQLLRHQLSLWNSLPASTATPPSIVTLELHASINSYTAINCHSGTPCQPQQLLCHQLSLWNSLPASRVTPPSVVTLKLPASLSSYSAINCHSGTLCQSQQLHRRQLLLWKSL